MRIRIRRLGPLGLVPLSLCPTDFATAADSRRTRRDALSDKISENGVSTLDWVVIVAYALGMIAVGWYCSRRATTTEDYLLGGRAMKPWAVGLSLFATLMSTISYLAVPGEMIQHGPMVASQILAFPFIMIVVGWFLIPRIMKLNVTSAYEILETRLGVACVCWALCFSSRCD